MKLFCLEEIQICSNEGQHPSPRGDHCKIKFVKAILGEIGFKYIKAW